MYEEPKKVVVFNPLLIKQQQRERAKTTRKVRPTDIIHKNVLFKKEEPKPEPKEVVSSNEDSESEAKLSTSQIKSDVAEKLNLFKSKLEFNIVAERRRQLDLVMKELELESLNSCLFSNQITLRAKTKAQQEEHDRVV